MKFLIRFDATGKFAHEHSVHEDRTIYREIDAVESRAQATRYHTQRDAAVSIRNLIAPGVRVSIVTED